MSLPQDCMSLISKKLASEISADEYYCGIVGLDKKYPGKGFKQAAEDWANKIRENEKHEKPKPKQVDHKMQAAGDEQEVPF